MKDHLITGKNYEYRCCLTKFLVSSHRLRIEVGRHQKPKLPLERTIRTFCDKNEIVDEIYLNKTCQFHNGERRILLNAIQHDSNHIRLEDMCPRWIKKNSTHLVNCYTHVFINTNRHCIVPKYWVYKYYIVYKVFYNVFFKTVISCLCFTSHFIFYHWAVKFMYRDIYF